MRHIPVLQWAAIMAVCGVLSLALPVQAAGGSIINVSAGAALAVPASAIPAGYTVQPMESYPIARSSMLPLMGKQLTGQFLRDGWTAGYHGWLDRTDRSLNAFVTYDFHGFKNSAGASEATGSYEGLVLGVVSTVVNKRLPAGAAVFIDGTGTYGAAQQPFVVVDVVFRVQNVLADVTGYFAGSDTTVTDEATTITINASASLARWLTLQAHAVNHGSLDLPLLPALALSVALRPRKPGA